MRFGAGIAALLGGVWFIARLFLHVLTPIVQGPKFLTEAAKWKRELLPFLEQTFLCLNQFFSNSGAFLFIALSLLLFFNEKLGRLIEPIYLSIFKPRLSIEYENVTNQINKQPEPYGEIHTYYTSEGGPSKGISHKYFYVGIRNNSAKMSVRNVKVRLISGGIPERNFGLEVPPRNNVDSVDISPLGAEYFLLGFSYSRGGEIPDRAVQVDQKQFDSQREKSNWGLFIPERYTDAGEGEYKVTSFLRNDRQNFVFEVIADDVTPVFAVFRVDAKDRTKVYLVFQSEEEARVRQIRRDNKVFEEITSELDVDLLNKTYATLSSPHQS